MKKFTRMIASILCILMILETIPVSSFANAYQEDVAVEESEQYEKENEDDAPSSVIQNEVVGLRTEDSKQYKMSDGSFIAVKFGENVHYKENGKYLDIDNTLVESKDGKFFENKDNEVKYSFTSDVENNEAFSCKFEEYELKFTISQSKTKNEKESSKEDNAKLSDVETDVSDGKESNAKAKSVVEELKNSDTTKEIKITNPNPDKKDNSDNSNDKSPQVYNIDEIDKYINADSAIEYKNKLPGVDLKYNINGNVLKESIVLNDNTADNIYSFKIDTKLDAVLNKDGSISLNDGDKSIYTIIAPYMFDAENKISLDVAYSIEKRDDGTYIVLKASEEWLKSDERVYPVTIDPSLTLTKYGTTINGDIFTQYYSTGNGLQYSGTGLTYMGYDSSGDHEYYSYMKIVNLPELPNNTQPIGAIVAYGQVDYDTTGRTSFDVSCHEATADNYWYVNYQSYVEDTQILSNDTNNEYVSWNITRLAKKWYNDSSTNHGIVFTTPDVLTNTDCAKATFIGYNNAGFASNYLPKFIVYYRNVVGIEDYYTYHTQDIGRAGTGYIKDYDERLTIVKPDCTSSGTAMPFTISHIFNSAYADRYFNVDPEHGINTNYYYNMLVGKGWKLSIQQTLMQSYITNANNGVDSVKIYTDEDGTEHYFYYDSDTSTYKDEDGLGLSVTESSDNVTLTMSDDQGNVKIFKNGYLYQIKDANNNIITLKYGSVGNNVDGDGVPCSTRHRVVAVTQTNNRENEKTIAILEYGGNVLTKIINEFNEETIYGFDDYNHLTSIIHSDDTLMSYAYNYYYDMTSAYDGELGYCINFTYQTNHAVSSIFESNSGNEIGKSFWFNKTDEGKLYVRYSGQNRVFNTEASSPVDDIITTYLFDNFGRTVNSYSSNIKDSDAENGQFNIYGTGITAYTATESVKSPKNNKISTQANTSSIADNLIRNGGFENDGIWENESAYRTTEEHHTGNYSLKITSASPNRSQSKQWITLKKGTYTISAYVKTASLSSNENGGAEIYIAKGTGDENQNSRIITSTNSEIENGWERISFTKTVSENEASYCIVARIVDANGIAYVDDIQVEKGEGASNVNLLDCGGGEGYYSTSPWVCTSGDATIASTSNAFMGSNAFVLKSNMYSTCKLMNNVNINSDKTTSYVLSGWGYAKSVAYHSTDTDDDPKFKLYAKVFYTDNTNEIFDTKFNADIYGEWQYTSRTIVPKKSVDRIEVYCFYANNNTWGYFDNISLIKESSQTYKYDSNGKVIAANTSEVKDTASYSYSDGNLINATKPGSGTYIFEYNNSNNSHLASKVINDMGTTDTTDDIMSNIVYDAAGNTTTTDLYSGDSDSMHLLTGADYSERNYLTSQTDTNGITTSYEYNSKKLVNQTITPVSSTYEGSVNKVINTQYDSSNRIRLSYLTGNISLSYAYANGNLSSITRGGYNGSTSVSQTYSFEYDAWGNRTKSKVGPTELATYTYASGNGNMMTMNYGNNSTQSSNSPSISYEYDTLDRIISVSYNGNVRYTYCYESSGALSKATEADTGNVIYYQYDSLGRLISEATYNESNSVSQLVDCQYYEYDDCSRNSKVISQTPVNSVTSEYTYSTSNGNLNFYTNTYNQSSTQKTDTLAYAYDNINRVSVKSINDGTRYIWGESVVYKNRSSIVTTNQVSDLNISFGANAICYKYEYDNVGNIKTVKDGNNNELYNYVYDLQNQLVIESDSVNNVTYKYDYDTYGNIRRKSTYDICGISRYSDLSYFTPSSYVEFDYEDDNQKDFLTSYDGNDITYDTIGNPLSWYNGAEMTWVDGRKLASYTTDDNTEYQYTYNIDGKRATKNVDGITHTYYYTGDTLMSEVWGNNSLTFLYDESSSAYGFVYNNGTTEAKYYYIKNQQGDVVALGDSNGNIIAKYNYDAWGKLRSVKDNSGNIITSESNIAIINTIRYRGYYYDNETGFYYLNSRYYDPEICRFINLDSQLNSQDGFLGYNMFSYSNNNPVMYSDPSGHSIILACIIVGAVVGALAGGHIAAKVSKKKTGKVNGWAVAGGIAGGAVVGALIGWGVGAAVTAIGAAATGTAIAATKDKIIQGTQKVASAVENSQNSLSFSASKTISNDVINLPRVGSALKIDEFHSFSNIVDNYAGLATQSPISNGTIYQLQGSLNGKLGRFEWIIQNQQVTHRMFVEGGGINGIPIVP